MNNSEHEQERQKYFTQGRVWLALGALVCIAASMGLSVEAQKMEEPPLALKMLTPFGMACAIVLLSYALKRVPAQK